VEQIIYNNVIPTFGSEENSVAFYLESETDYYQRFDQWHTQEFLTGGAYPGFHEVAASGGSREGQSGHGLWPPTDEDKNYCSINVPDFLIILRNYYLKQENVSFSQGHPVRALGDA